MNALFSRMLAMCLAAGWMVPALCLLRLVLSRCPRRYVVLLGAWWPCGCSAR